MYDSGQASVHFQNDFVFTAVAGPSGGWISPCVELATSESFPIFPTYARAAVMVGGVSLTVETGRARNLCLPPDTVGIHFDIGVSTPFTLSLDAFSYGGVAFARLNSLEFYDEHFQQMTGVEFTLVPEPATLRITCAALLLAAFVKTRMMPCE